ncbi:MAG: GNAT family N-acetyltransferase [Myxococcota bacterium]
MAADEVFVVDHGTGADHAAVGRLLSHGFAMNPGDVKPYLSLVGADNLRVIRDGADVVGTAALIPMGQYFGHRSVATTGVAGVAVAPHYQRQGVATALMRDLLRELAEAGMGLSTLYGSTLSLYRKVGYECAGARYVAELDAKTLGVDERGGILLPMDAAGETRVRALYGAHAPSFAGHLDRGEYIWTRLLHPWAGHTPHCVMATRDDGHVEGYVAYSKRSRPDDGHDIHVHDLFATSAWGYRRLWSFIAGLSTSLVRRVVLHTAPQDPARLVLPDAHFTVSLADAWMLRIANVEAAMAERGYPPRLAAELDLDVYDDVVDSNNGQWRLTVRSGRGTLRRGGTGALRTDMRGLAALYSGFSQPAGLAATGQLHGTPAALALAGSIFSGPQPWMREMF